MERSTFAVPKMFADHHVEEVRRALQKIEGILEIEASSALKRVVVRYEANQVTPGVIAQALRTAGYEPGTEPLLPRIPENKDDDSPWFVKIQRVTSTNSKDLEMSGDFRKY